MHNLYIMLVCAPIHMCIEAQRMQFVFEQKLLKILFILQPMYIYIYMCHVPGSEPTYMLYRMLVGENYCSPDGLSLPLVLVNHELLYSRKFSRGLIVADW